MGRHNGDNDDDNGDDDDKDRRMTSRSKKESSKDGSLKKEKRSRRDKDKDDGRRRRKRDDDESVDSDSADNDDRRRKARKKKRKKPSSSSRERDRDRDRDRDRKKSSKRKNRKHRKKKSKQYSSSSSDESSSSSTSDDSSSSSSSEDDSDEQKGGGGGGEKKVVINARLLAKLEARGETLEERRERRAQKRAAHIATKFGYTPEDNPFHDPNLHEAFTWKKKQEKKPSNSKTATTTTTLDKKKETNTLEEIEKVRQRRKEREQQLEEMERIRAEESRMKELENFDEWARKEEEFHLQQQRQRSAIRLVEGREKPIDILAKNLLLFGLSEEEKQNRASVKYKEKFNALEALEKFDAELEEPYKLLQMLKLEELQELILDINAFRALERESLALSAVATGDDENYNYMAGNTNQGATSHNNSNTVLRYWDALHVAASDEIVYLQTGGKDGAHAKMAADIQKIFKGQSIPDLIKMQLEVQDKLRQHARGGGVGSGGIDPTFDRDYWKSVDQQLTVYLAKSDLSELHNQMLVRQLERLERRREELARRKAAGEDEKQEDEEEGREEVQQQKVPDNVASPEFGNAEENFGQSDEIDMPMRHYSWQDKYRPRKPRYFNRVKTGYDWNKYNQTHYDKDNPPPKTVQGYKFNIFYPDLIDNTKTPQFVLEPADSPDFVIIRFKAGPPYEDLAFKIINREWNKSRKRGYKCTFERGILSVYFNFKTHWYRR